MNGPEARAYWPPLWLMREPVPLYPTTLSETVLITRRGRTVYTHGYTGYSNGCRCRTCRDGKAAYMRDKRARAIERATHGEPAPDGIKHGTRVAYKDHGCRCDPCVTAMRAIWLKWYWQGKPELGAQLAAGAAEAPGRPAGYCADCWRSGVGVCDAFPDCPNGRSQR